MQRKYKVLAMILAMITLIVTENHLCTNVFALPNNSNLTTNIVYVDGNAIKVSVNSRTGLITAESLSRKDDSCLEISMDGDAVTTVYDPEEDEYVNYALEINDLSQDEVDIEVIDDEGNIVDSYEEVDDLLEDTYEGQAAVTVLTGITVGSLITAVLKVAACIAVAGVVYYGAKAAVKTIQRTRSKQKYYYKAYIYNKNVFIAIRHSISKAAAINRLRKRQNIYTYTSTLAKSAVLGTGLGCTRKEISDLRGKIRFYHYHTANRNGSHAFFGLPYTY